MNRSPSDPGRSPIFAGTPRTKYDCMACNNDVEMDMILKLAAASAAAYGLYRFVRQRNEDGAKFQPAANTSVTPLAQRGPYVSPV
jgi:hypothetical protein